MLWALYVFPMGTVWALYGHCTGTVWALRAPCLFLSHHTRDAVKQTITYKPPGEANENQSLWLCCTHCFAAVNLKQNGDPCLLVVATRAEPVEPLRISRRLLLDGAANWLSFQNQVTAALHVTCV